MELYSTSHSVRSWLAGSISSSPTSEYASHSSWRVRLNRSSWGLSLGVLTLEYTCWIFNCLQAGIKLLANSPPLSEWITLILSRHRYVSRFRKSTAWVEVPLAYTLAKASRLVSSKAVKITLLTPYHHRITVSTCHKGPDMPSFLAW